MKSLRRTQVFTANIAKMANVTSRIRWSLIVVHDKIPRATYAIMPAIKRFTPVIQLAPEFPHFVRDFGCGLPLRSRPQSASTLVHRGGFEPPYLARRNRFTVCRL
jgi:hypothetical protein